MSQLIWAVCNRPVGFGMDLGCHWRLGRLYGPRIVLSIVRHGDVLPGECFWAPPRRNIMKPQGVLHFSVPVGEDAERRQGGGTFPDYFGCLEVLVENEGDSQVSQKMKTLEQSQKRPHAIIVRGAHDSYSHDFHAYAPVRPARS